MANFFDPTRPPMARSARTHRVSPHRDTRRWTLTSTVVSPGRRIAIINGTAVRVGEQVDGARLVEILPHAVTLRRGSREFTIPLARARIKSPAEAAEDKMRAK